MFKLTTQNHRIESGFTLIELMVATSVFLILVTLSTGVFIQTLRTQRTLSAVTAANESASQALEQIARETRTGYNFGLSLSDTLIFTSSQANNQTVGYKKIGNSIGRCLTVCVTDSDFKAITPSNVMIEKLNFFYHGVNPADNAPPRVTIVMTVGSVNDPSLVGTGSDIQTNLQTTLSARNVAK